MVSVLVASSIARGSGGRQMVFDRDKLEDPCCRDDFCRRLAGFVSPAWCVDPDLHDEMLHRHVMDSLRQAFPRSKVRQARQSWISEDTMSALSDRKAVLRAMHDAFRDVNRLLFVLLFHVWRGIAGGGEGCSNSVVCARSNLRQARTSAAYTQWQLRALRNRVVSMLRADKARQVQSIVSGV
eukprot:5452323-Alexandrium_andersonii.AAC.1